MRTIHFETTVKDGYIKIPDEYSRLNNKKVLVEILNREAKIKHPPKNRAEEFIRRYTGMLADKQIPADIDIKTITAMRVADKYDL